MPQACAAADLAEDGAANALFKVREAVLELQEVGLEGRDGVDDLVKAKARLASAIQAAKEAGATTEELLEASKAKTFDADDPEVAGAEARRLRKIRQLKKQEIMRQKVQAARQKEATRGDRIAAKAADRRAKALEEEKLAEQRRAARAERAEKNRIEAEKQEQKEAEDKAHRKKIKEKAKELLRSGIPPGGSVEDGTLALLNSPADDGAIPPSGQDVIPPIDDGPVSAEDELERALKRARQADAADAALAQAGGGGGVTADLLEALGGSPVPMGSPESDGGQKGKKESLASLLGRPEPHAPSANTGEQAGVSVGMLAGAATAAVRRLGVNDLVSGGIETKKPGAWR